jgi:hypothetical protein
VTYDGWVIRRTEPNPEEVLRALARLLAPYVADELDARPDVARRAERTQNWTVDDAQARVFVAGLGHDLTEYALIFFEMLSQEPHRVPMSAVADALGATNGREVAGLLITPLKRHRERERIAADPWQESSGPNNQRVFQDRDGNAQRIYQALLEHRKSNHWIPNLEELLTHPETRRPVPTSIYVWAPEYADKITDGEKGGSSCLATDRPGTRAVIYRAHEDQGIVALFDVGADPKPDQQWGYYTQGRFHTLSQQVTRDELLEVSELAPIFRHIQGRRRIPSPAQRALGDLLKSRFVSHNEAPPELPVFQPVDQQGTPRRR